jgi:hypothetical protein
LCVCDGIQSSAVFKASHECVRLSVRCEWLVRASGRERLRRAVCKGGLAVVRRRRTVCLLGARLRSRSVSSQLQPVVWCECAGAMVTVAAWKSGHRLVEVSAAPT